jgi:hypothetical protein
MWFIKKLESLWKLMQKLLSSRFFISKYVHSFVISNTIMTQKGSSDNILNFPYKGVYLL